MTGRIALACLCALSALFPGTLAFGQTLVITVTPLGSSAKERPLPVGATPNLTIIIQNGEKRALGPITLTARFEGLSGASSQGWRVEGGALHAEIARIAAGERAQRTLKLKVERAPLAAALSRVRVEARTPDGTVSIGETELNVADCVGAYREKLAELRSGLSQTVRDAAEELRKPDPALPGGRLFSATGARSSELAGAERFAAAFAVRRGGDAQMATEWFRFLVQRWTSELNAYSGQSANPGMCANNYYQIAGYRQGLMPITKRIETIHASADSALAAARAAAKGEPGETLSVLVQRVIKGADLAPNGDEPGEAKSLAPLAALASAREMLSRERKLEADDARKLSLAETAAWLAETDRRGQALMQSIEGVLASIVGAHKESCVCAF
ncbi:MAG: hypothetical protein WD871_08810 [Xanthobacteraceae bacterium]